jgi:hypothetical protein
MPETWRRVLNKSSTVSENLPIGLYIDVDHRNALCVLAAASLAFTLNVRSASFDFEFNTVPPGQGWQYVDSWDTTAEGQIYSLTSDGRGGAALRMQSSWMTPGFTAPHYVLPDVVNPTQPFSLSFRASVTAFEDRWPEGFWPLSFQVFVCTGTESYGIHLGPDRFAYGSYSGIRDYAIVPTAEIPFDNSWWRDYRIEAIPGETVSYYVNDVLVASAAVVPDIYPAANGIVFGDLLAPTGGIASISNLTFTQVPEPGASALAAGALMLGYAGYRRWRRQGAA